MVLPRYADIHLPLITLIMKTKVHTIKEAEVFLGQHFELTEEERNIKLDSGRRQFYTQVNFSIMLLKRNGYIFKEIKPFIATLKARNHLKLVKQYYINELKGLTDTQFEHFSGILLAKMFDVDYINDVEITPPQNDGGIDGIVHLKDSDIYFESKCYSKNSIPPLYLRSFVGALEGVNGKRGFFVTTSNYSRESKEYIRDLSRHDITLIDGQKLAQLIIDYKIMNMT
ncbi:restriction endonuclease [Guptibacillus hwajinpoensis]|uniref:restriction endonuclease n=1 Tax=Guptibacillus hwajinpoensis TaxID=208199 RepID=UPI003D074E95